jgi:hypothetical protein
VNLEGRLSKLSERKILGGKRRFWLTRVHESHGFRCLFSRWKSSLTVSLRQAARKIQSFYLALFVTEGEQFYLLDTIMVVSQGHAGRKIMKLDGYYR